MYLQKTILILLLFFFFLKVFSQNGILNKEELSNYEKAVNHYHSDNDSALFYIKKSISDSVEMSKHSLAKSYLFGGVLYKNLGLIDSAYYSYNTSNKLFVTINDKIGVASVQNNLARLYQQSGRLDLSLEALLKSVHLFESGNDSLKLADAYTNLGDLYIELEQIDIGIKYLKKGREIYSQFKNKVGESFILTNIGTLKEKNNQLDSALFYYKQSLKLLTNINREKLYADCCLKIARIYTLKKEFEQAIFYLKKAEKKYTQVVSPFGIAKCKYGMGNYYAIQNKNRLAIKNYNNALKLAKEVNASILYKDILFELYNSYKKEQNFSKALFFFKEYKLIKDSLFGVEAANNITLVQAKNDLLLHQNQIDKLRDSTKIQKLLTEKIKLTSEKRQTGIIGLIIIIIVIILVLILLYYRYVEKNKLNKNLSIALSEREILLKELHHRVKNNLQIISSLLNLQKKYKANKSVDEILELSRNRIATMVSVHEKLYRSKSLKDVDIKEYTEELVSNLASSFNSKDKKIQVKIVSEDIKIDVSKLIPCGLILNELITNSFKHAFVNSNNGVFDIDISESNNTVIVNVKDNGIGLPSEEDILQSDSLGMKLITGLTGQISGNLEILKPKMGTHFRISFKK